MTIRTFPALVGVVFPVIRTPTWNTSSLRSVSGKRSTLGYYSYPIYAYELGYDVLRSDITNKEWQELLAFFNTVGGKRDLFAFNDTGDNSVTDQAFGTGDGVTTQFQLVRTLTGLTFTWVDPVFLITTATIKVNAVVKSTPADYSIDGYGKVTFTSPPANGLPLTWTGTYKWGCRFDQDTAELTQFANNFWELKKIKFSTEKLP